MPRDEKKVLIQSIDRYIDYWKKTLKDAEFVCPARSRSSEMGRIMRGMKRLIGTHQVDQRSTSYVKGDSSVAFAPDIKRFSSRIMPVGSVAQTEEKKLIEEFFDRGDKESAAKLLRFVYMVEFETSSLHYAIMIKEWLKDKNIQLKSYISGRDGASEELESLSERLKEVENSRDSTEKVFFTHWRYIRDNAMREKIVEAMCNLNATKDRVLDALNEERQADENVKNVRATLFKGMVSFQEGINVVLQDSDKNKTVEVRREQPAQNSTARWEGLASIFSSSRDSSGLSRADIRAYQSNSSYPKSRDYVKSLMDKLFDDYSKIDGLMELFFEREDHRQASKEGVEEWHRTMHETIKGLLNDEQKKKRISELYYLSMSAELSKSTTSQESLCAKLEEFMINKYQLLADGNWKFEKNMRTTQKPEDCLKRENIARFRKNMGNYKSSSQNTRISYARINRVLAGSIFIGMSLIALKGILAVLPASVHKYVMISKLMGILTIPTSITLGILCVATIMIGLNIRNAMKMKGYFKASLDDFTSNEYVDEVEEDAVPQESYSQWIGRGVGTALSFMNCFSRCRNRQHAQENGQEDGKFMGDNGHSDQEEEWQNSFSHWHEEIPLDRKRSDSLESIELDEASNHGPGPGGVGGVGGV